MNRTTYRSALRVLAFDGALTLALVAPTFSYAQSATTNAGILPSLRPPSVPLVANDPYFSIWSNSNKLYSDDTRHWTGRENSLSAMVRVDGQTFRLMGRDPEESASLPQTDVSVMPTHTMYTFANDKIEVKLVFLTPAIPSDLDVLSRPVTYVTYTVRSLDRKRHDVQFYADASVDCYWGVKIPIS